ncbi:MAG: GNAT family N-acetyltransferase [Azospirillaceae bacterium]|nr:GNAT family N-acetyltransferase [Azospirillaceae bacterium]
MNHITIRRPSPPDFAAIAEIYADEAVVAQTAQLPFGDAAFWGAFYKARDPHAIEFVAEIDGKIVGHLGIWTNAHPRRKHVASFGIGVHSAFQRRGVGNALMAAMIAMTDNWLNITRLELGVFADNENAIRLYEKFGFEREGLARAACFRAGRYVDTLSMARLRLE